MALRAGDDLLGFVFGLALVQGHYDAHAGLVVEDAGLELRPHAELAAVAAAGVHVQRVAVPLAVGAGDHRALDGGVVGFGEHVQRGRAEDVVLVAETQQLQPRGVDVHDDAFLDEHERVRRFVNKCLELLLELVGGPLHRHQRAGLATVVELAQADGLQAHAIADRYEVLGANGHRLADRLVVAALRYGDDGDLGRQAVADVDDLRQLLRHVAAYAIEDQLGGAGLYGPAQVGELLQPFAVSGAAAVSERLADGFRVVLTRRHHRDGYGGLIAQSGLLGFCGGSTRFTAGPPSSAERRV